MNLFIRTYLRFYSISCLGSIGLSYASLCLTLALRFSSIHTTFFFSRALDFVALSCEIKFTTRQDLPFSSALCFEVIYAAIQPSRSWLSP